MLNKQYIYVLSTKRITKLCTSYLGANAYLLSNTTLYISLQHNASIILDTWGLVYVCSKSATIFASLQKNASIILDTWGLMCIDSKVEVQIKTRINLLS